MIWGSETWILSAYPNMESTVAYGPYQGLSLTQLIDQLGASLMGKPYQRFQNAFPLLLKLIDARDPLSIQVHPSDEIADRHNKGPVGKTEMWYALPSEKDAYLFSGLKSKLTPQTFKQHVLEHSIVDDLARYPVTEGDCFFLPAGRIHAIGAGCQLLEIQQSNDLTYRIYDYDRRDAHGNLRELHTDLAADAIDYAVLPDYQTNYQTELNQPIPLVDCAYFQTTLYQVTDHVEIDWTQENRFLIFVITKGEGTLFVDEESIHIHASQTFLFPATTQHIIMRGNITIVAVTCPCS